MKVTVYRRKLEEGVGPPEGFLGDHHPSEDDWVQSAKSVQSDGLDEHTMLHHMARDFLIRSMYHVTEPRFIGFAVENYGAACKALRCSLPLKEEQATWPNFELSEVDPASPMEMRWMLKHIAKVFGSDAARQQAKTLYFEWPREVTSEQLAEAMKNEILEDVKNGRVPATVSSFSQLHNHVDANCYGGTEALLDEWDDAAPHNDEGHRAALDRLCNLCNPAMDMVDAWIKAGGIVRESKAWTSRADRSPGF